MRKKDKELLKRVEREYQKGTIIPLAGHPNASLRVTEAWIVPTSWFLPTIIRINGVLIIQKPTDTNFLGSTIKSDGYISQGAEISWGLEDGSGKTQGFYGLKPEGAFGCTLIRLVEVEISS